MEKNIKRLNYYTNNRYGFAIYLISRLYNDLNINQQLFKSLKSPKYDSIKIYLFKITLAHLKEALKLFGRLTKSHYYKEFYIDMIKNPENKQIFSEIKDEFENPKDYPNTVNAKYLDVRNDIFHYGIENDDFNEYVKIQGNLDDKEVFVTLNINNNSKYISEIGVDFPKMYNVFDEKSGEEVNQLLNKIIKLCRNILSDYSKNK